MTEQRVEQKIEQAIQTTKSLSSEGGKEALDLVITRLESDVAYIQRLKSNYDKFVEQENHERAAEVLEEVHYHFVTNMMGNLRLDRLGKRAHELRTVAVLEGLVKPKENAGQKYWEKEMLRGGSKDSA